MSGPTITVTPTDKTTYDHRHAGEKKTKQLRIIPNGSMEQAYMTDPSSLVQPGSVPAADPRRPATAIPVVSTTPPPAVAALGEFMGLTPPAAPAAPAPAPPPSDFLPRLEAVLGRQNHVLSALWQHVASTATARPGLESLGLTFLAADGSPQPATVPVRFSVELGAIEASYHCVLLPEPGDADGIIVLVTDTRDKSQVRFAPRPSRTPLLLEIDADGQRRAFRVLHGGVQFSLGALDILCLVQDAPAPAVRPT